MKLSLSNLASGFRSSNKLNENFQAIRDAFNNTLSRDGSTPNAMLAPLDMNSERIINLGAPVNDTDAARLLDIKNNLQPGTEVDLMQGVVADAQTFFGVAISSGTQVVAGSGFTQSMVGKRFVLPRAGAAYFSIARGLVGNVIAVAPNGASLTISTQALSTVSAANYSEIIIGTDDTEAWRTAIDRAHVTGTKTLYFKGHSIITDTLYWKAVEGVVVEGGFTQLSLGPWHYADGNYLTSTGNSNYIAANAESRIIWAGGPDKAMTCQLLERRNRTTRELDSSGVWAMSQGSGIKGVLLDCAGATCTGVAFRGASAAIYEDVTVYRHPRATVTSYTLDVNGIQNYDGAWDLGVPLNATFYNSGMRPVDSAGNKFTNCWATTRGTGIGASIGWWLWGDRQWGNFCESDFFGGGAITDDSGAGTIYGHFEQSDSCTFPGFTWNNEFVLHASNTGVRSTDAGVMAPTTGGQARSHHFVGYCGLLRVKGYVGTLPGGITRREDVSANNHSHDGFPVENIVRMHAIEPGGVIRVSTQGSRASGGAGGYTFGGRPPSTAVFRTSNVSIPTSALTTINWQQAIGTSISKPLIFTGPMGSSGAETDTWSSSTNPNRITVPNGVQWVSVRVGAAWLANATGTRVLWLLKNGDRVDRSGDQGATGGEPTVSVINGVHPVSPGDYFEVQAFQNSGSALDIIGSSSDLVTRFEVEFH